MPKNSNPKGSVMKIRFATAKVQAMVQTIEMLLLIWGAVGLVVATIFSLILSIAGLNPSEAFLRSFVGCFIICVFFFPGMWRLNLAQICQAEGLWDEADKKQEDDIDPSNEKEH